MEKFTFLTKEQIFGEKKLDIIKRYGTKAAVTDFSILLNGYASTFSTDEDENTRTGFWWTKSSDMILEAYAVTASGDQDYYAVIDREIGCRPAINYSSIMDDSSFNKRGYNSVLEVLYGEYPQTVAFKDYSSKLERLYQNGQLNKTGKSYTADSADLNDFCFNFKPITFTEYDYNGCKYIRFVSGKNYGGQTLSNGEIIIREQPYWVRVEPIVWLVDEKADIALSKNIIFSGIKFKNEANYKGVFEETDIYSFMNDIFAKEIKPIKSEKEAIKEDANSYAFDLSEVSEEDIIRGAIESDISVFLHGKSSDGKSARIKKLDPDCEIIYMRNATPDSLNGKSVYDASTGKMIDVPPSWYKKTVEKCKSEPDKVHLVFFDELTNALPSMQGMAFNIILDREVNGKWKLPKNARVVAAGNDYKDSLAASKMAEPLFNRFAHVYINTKVDDWLKWAMDEEKCQKLDYEECEYEEIHPAIISYIEYKNNRGINVLRTTFNGVIPNADPRKWDMASKVLYKTNKPEMLRALIGEDLTRDFIKYLKYEESKEKELKRLRKLK